MGKTVRFTCFAAIVAVSLSVLIHAGCTAVAPPTTQPVLTTQPSTQPTTQPSATVPPVLQTTDKVADFVVQHADLVATLFTLLGISAAGHATNIAKTAAGVYQSIRNGTATAESVAVAGTEVAAEVAALDPKIAPVIAKVESVASAVAKPA